MRRRGLRSGLSLVELLVTVTIIGITFSMLPPFLMNLHRKGSEVQCRNNLRQLMLSYRVYMATNSGMAPASYLDWDGPALPRWNRRYERDPVTGTPSPLPTQAQSWWAEIPDHLKSQWLQTRSNGTHNLLGFYSAWTGLRPRGLGRLFASGEIKQVEYLYCPADRILFPDDEISGLANGNGNWLLKYPLLTSYIVRPVGVAVPWEQEHALRDPFDANPGAKVFLTEISGHHTNGVHVARVNGAVEFIEGVPVYGRAFSAYGVKAGSLEKVLQPAYVFDIRLSPWIWLALDDPDNADAIIRGYSTPGDGDDGDDDDGDDDDGDDDDDDDGDDDDGDDDDGDDDDGDDDDGDDDDGDDGRRVVICHVAGGNPPRMHTITVAPSAVAAHLAHGDHLGPCDGTETGNEDGGDESNDEAGHTGDGSEDDHGNGCDHGDQRGSDDDHGVHDDHGNCGGGNGGHQHQYNHGDDDRDGNNGVGNGEAPQPSGNPPTNDGAGTGPGCPGQGPGHPANGCGEDRGNYTHPPF